MPSPTLRIFVSSTTHDLQSCREAVRNVLWHEGYEPIEQANFNASTRTLRTSLDDQIASCHAVICLAGPHCGEETLEPDGKTLRSHTQREYDTAVRLGKAVFAYLAGPECPLDHPANEPPERAARQEQHCVQLMARHHCQSFDSKKELELYVTRLAHEELRRMPWDWLYPPKLLTSSLLRCDRQRRPLPISECLHEEWHVLLPQGEQRQYPSLHEAVAGQRTLALVGGAGSGKTIALKQVLRHAAERAQRDRDQERPVWLQISDFRIDGPTVARMEEFTEEQLRQVLPDPALSPAEIRAALAAGRCLLLLDGLDELPRKQWKTRLASVAAFLETYGSNRLVVSARPGTELPQMGLPQVQMPPLSRVAQRRLVESLTQEHPGEAGRFEVWLRNASAAVRELADTPFFLHALVELFLRKSGSAPDQPAILLVEVLKKRLIEEYSSHGDSGWWGRINDEGYGDSDMLEVCLPALSALGFRALSGETSSRLPLRHAREHAPDGPCPGGPAAATFLHSASDLGIYTLTEDELVFTHALWRDLLAAREMQARLAREPSALPPGLHSPTTAGSWRQACIFLTQLFPVTELTSFYRQLRPLNRDLLAAVVAEGGALGDDALRLELAANLEAELAAEVQTLCARHLVARALGRAGDRRLWEYPLDPLVPAMVPIRGGEFRIGLDEADFEKLLPLQEKGIDPELREEELTASLHTLGDFSLGKFPITNAHYRLFVSDGGYGDRAWWDGPAWDWLQTRGGSERRPEHWSDARYCGENQPLVGVTFYEATAYARWLTARSNGARTFRLPTVAEWQAAARGASGRLFPWGDEPEADRCNCWHADDLGLTSPVGIYPAGATPEGLHDLAGCVSEMAVALDGGGPVICGGSWFSSIHGCRATQYSAISPTNASSEVGLRILEERR